MGTPKTSKPAWSVSKMNSVIGAGVVGAEAGEEGLDVGEGLLLVFAAHEVPALGGLAAGVGDEDGVDGRHVGEVFLRVAVGADEALLFAAEEDEAHGAAGWAAEGLDGAGDFEDGGDAGAVVLGAGGGMPGVEMSSDDDDGVGIFAAGDFGDDVVDFGGGADAVLEAEVNGDGASFEEALDEQFVFEADLGDGEGGHLAVEAEGAGVLGAVGSAGKKDGFGCERVEHAKGLDEVADAGLLAEAGAVDQDDVALDRVFGGGELFGWDDFLEVGDFAGDAVGGGGGTPAGGVDVEGLVARSGDVADGGGFGLPESGHGEGLGVDVFEAERFERLDCPGDGVDVVVGAGEAGADVVGEVAVVVVGFAVDHHVADEAADGGARLGRDGHCGGGGLCEGAGGRRNG